MNRAEVVSCARSHALGGQAERHDRRKSTSTCRTDGSTFLTELESSLAVVQTKTTEVLDNQFLLTSQHIAAVQQLAMPDNTMARYKYDLTGPLQAGSFFLRCLARRGGAKVRIAPTIVQDGSEAVLLQFDEHRGRSTVTQVRAKPSVVEDFVRLCARVAKRVGKQEHATCTVVALEKQPAIHGTVCNRVEPLTAVALHYRLSDSLDASRGFKLFQGFIKSRGRRSVVYRVVKDQSRPHVSAYAISSAYQYMSFDEHCPVKDCHRTQQVHYDNAEQLYDTICRAEATVDKAAVERHTIRLQNTVGKFYSTSLTRRGVMEEETIRRVRVSKVRGTNLQEVHEMLEHLIKFVEADVLQETMRRIRFAEVVADFTLDEEDRWWLLQVKAFRVQAPFHTLSKVPRRTWVHEIDGKGNKLPHRCELCGRKVASGDYCTKIPARSGYFLACTYRDAMLPLTEVAAVLLTACKADVQSERFRSSEHQVIACPFCRKLLQQSETLAASSNALAEFLAGAPSHQAEQPPDHKSMSIRTSIALRLRNNDTPFSARPANASAFQLIVTCHDIVNIDLPSYHRLRGRPARLTFSLGPHQLTMRFPLDYEDACDEGDGAESCRMVKNRRVPVRQVRMVSVVGDGVDLRARVGSRAHDLHLFVDRGDGLDNAMADAFSVLEGTATISFSGLNFNQEKDAGVLQKLDVLLPMQCHTLGVVLIKLTLATINIPLTQPEYFAWSKYSGQDNIPMLEDQRVFWPRSALSVPQPLPETWLAFISQDLTRASKRHKQTSNADEYSNLERLAIPGVWSLPRELVRQVTDQQALLKDGRISLQQLVLGLEQMIAACLLNSRDGANYQNQHIQHSFDGVLQMTKQDVGAVKIVVAILKYMLKSPRYPSAMQWSHLMAALDIIWSDHQPQVAKELMTAQDHIAKRKALLRSISHTLRPSARHLQDSQARQDHRLRLFVDLFAGADLTCIETEAGELHGTLSFAKETLEQALRTSASLPNPLAVGATAEGGTTRPDGVQTRPDDAAARGVLASNLLLCGVLLNDLFDGYLNSGTGIVTMEQFMVFAESTIQDIGLSAELQHTIMRSRIGVAWNAGRPQDELVEACNCSGLCKLCWLTRVESTCTIHGSSCFDMRDMYCLACERDNLFGSSNDNALENRESTSPPPSPARDKRHSTGDSELDCGDQLSVLTQVKADIRRESPLLRSEIDTQDVGRHWNTIEEESASLNRDR